MKASVIALLCLAVPPAFTFPSMSPNAILQIRNAAQLAEQSRLECRCPYANAKREAEAEPGCPFAKRQAPGVTPPFDASQQYVSNTGDHDFIAPSGSDARGPCPGLNAMANHGYLPRNGVGSMQQFIDGTAEVFGLGADLATILAVYGAIFTGDLTSFSIGGPVNGLLNLDGLLSTPQGLSGSHNKFEGDASPTRGDLYQYGNNFLLRLQQFQSLYELGQQNDDSIDLPLLTSYRATRFRESISQNPYFFNAPFSGLGVVPGAWVFIYRLMANKSAEYPTGLLTGETFKTFFAVSGDYPNFQYTPGHERIPDNWYKRNTVADPYTMPYFATDINLMAAQHPQFLSVGGNTGQPNTFVGLDPSDLTGGVYNSGNLLEGNNALCFAMQASVQQAPDFLEGLVSDVVGQVARLARAVEEAIAGLGCAQLTELDQALFETYPGYTRLKRDGTY